MILTNEKLDNTTMNEDCSWLVISREENAERRLLQGASPCSLLSQWNIDHLGIMSAQKPYEVFRANQSGTFFLACTSGEGDVLIDGEWKKISAGEACLFPPYMTNAFKARSEKPWEFAWVRYQEEPHKKTVANVAFPRVRAYNSELLKCTITGLQQELASVPPAKLISAWINLIHHQVLRFSQAEKIDPRVRKVFLKVVNDLSSDWTLTRLADNANLSGEHLRRLCNDQIGRSPMQQVTFIRIAYAKELLMKTDNTVEVVAEKTGYSNAFSFSNAFLKWVGCRPSDFR